MFQLSQSETFTSDLYAGTGSGDPVSLTGTGVAWPPQKPAQRSAEKVLLADLSHAVRNVDARGA